MNSFVEEYFCLPNLEKIFVIGRLSLKIRSQYSVFLVLLNVSPEKGKFGDAENTVVMSRKPIWDEMMERKDIIHC